MELDVVAALAATLRALTPGDVRSGVRPIRPEDEHALHPEERAAVQQAVARRRHEFASGRALLRQLIGGDVTIPVGQHRAPVWPVGVCGTLAHDHAVVVAAVAEAPAVRGLGIDLEPSGALELDVARSILLADEAHLDAHLAFTLKEATFKAWSAGAGRLLEHHDVRLDVADATFRAQVLVDGRTFAGGFASVAGRWLALVVDRAG